MISQKEKSKKRKHTALSFFTTLQLSFNNLLTKKGRTFLTSFAGSIGIIGISLILSLSNGASKYISNIEKYSLSNSPIELDETSLDFSKLSATTSTQKDEEKVEDNTIYSEDDISSQIKLLTSGLLKENNLKEFKKYIENNKEFEENSTDIQYDYNNLSLQIYSTINSSYRKINPNTFSILGKYDTEDEQTETTQSSEDGKELFEELINNDDILKNKYDILAGKIPENYNEIVLIVDKNNKIPDTVLYSLDLKDRKELPNILLTLISNNENAKIATKSYRYDDILNTKYKLILNTDYYKYENGIYKDYSSDPEYMKNIVDNGLDLNIVGILRSKDGSDSGKVGYKHSLTDYVINTIAQTDISKKQIENTEINVLTGNTFDGISDTYKSNCKKLGIVDLDSPSKISIYPKNYESKNKIVELINTYNSENKANGKEDLVISYTDVTKAIIGGVISIINIVSKILVAFVSISLVVSSIMIAIVTYISVLERTKEIGILRAIGASKRDIKRVFISETIIEGLIAGILGIGITTLLCVLINIIVKIRINIDNIAVLPVLSGIILILFSVLLNVIAGRIPSKIASKKDPVEALRSE